MNIEFANERMNTAQWIVDAIEFAEENYGAAVSKLLNQTLMHSNLQGGIPLKEWLSAFDDYVTTSMKKEEHVATEIMEMVEDELNIADDSRMHTFLTNVLLRLNPESVSTYLNDEFISRSKLEHVIVLVMYDILKDEFRKQFIKRNQWDFIIHVTKRYFKREYPVIVENTTHLSFINDADVQYGLIQNQCNNLYSITIGDEWLIYIKDISVIDDLFDVTSISTLAQPFNELVYGSELGSVEGLYSKTMYLEELFFKISFIRSVTDSIYSKGVNTEDEIHIQQLTHLWNEVIKEIQEETYQLIDVFPKVFQKMKKDDKND